MAERGHGLHPNAEYMGGELGVTCSLDQSCDLGNESHFDTHDASNSISIWTELKEGEAKNWYFLMPNLQVFKEGKIFSGVAVKLSHGTSVSWDGRIIRHCTTVTDLGTEENHVFGTFWGAKSKQVKVCLETVEEE
jgi:hypothetical protein